MTIKVKTTRSVLWAILLCAVSLRFACNLQAAKRADGFWFTEGHVWAVQGEEIRALTEDIHLSMRILVSTNGSFKVGTYPPRRFAEGQVLTSDGRLLSPDGRMELVIDHVGMTAGHPFKYINGGITNGTQNIPLGRDKVLTPDRVLMGRDGSWMRVIDGLLFDPDGTPIPAFDTITLQQGKVVVQKENTQLIIGAGRSIMMNEGTKVFGDGRVISKDGTITHLGEGQILIIEGVVKLR